MRTAAHAAAVKRDSLPSLLSGLQGSWCLIIKCWLFGLVEIVGSIPDVGGPVALNSGEGYGDRAPAGSGCVMHIK